MALAHDPNNPFNQKDPTRLVEKRLADLEVKIRAAEKAGVPASALQPLRFIVRWDTSWPPGSALTVCFWNGTARAQNFVMEAASTWSRYGHVTFNAKEGGRTKICTSDESADIKISLDTENPPDLYEPDDDKNGNWSMLGKFSGYARISMNLPVVPVVMDSDPDAAKRVVLHEFGHAIGLAHEHRREECKGWFDLKKIAKHYGWPMKKVIYAIDQFSKDERDHSRPYGDYDNLSIMHYNFESFLFKRIKGKVNPCLRKKSVYQLSAKDIEGVRQLYGDPVVAQPSSSITSYSARKAREQLASFVASHARQAPAATNQKSKNARADQIGRALDDVMVALAKLEELIPPGQRDAP